MDCFKSQEFIILDVETTGLSPLNGDRVIEIAALKLNGLEPAGYFHSLIDPNRPLSWGAYMINGITPQMLDGAPEAKDVLPGFSEFASDALIVGHNIKFDLKFLENEYYICGLTPLKERRAFDTVKMARKLLPELRTYALRHVSVYLDVPIAGLHRAKADVELTYKIFYDLLHRAYGKDIQDMDTLFKYFGSEYKPKYALS